MPAVDIENHEEERRRFAFEKMAQDFIEVYGPKDPHKQAEFSARLMTLLRQSFIDGGARSDKHLKEVIGCLPPSRPSGMGPL